MLFMISVPVSAAPTYSIEVTNTNSSVSINGNTYSAYKLFNATYNDTNGAITYTTDATCLNVTYQSKTGAALITWLETASATDVRTFADYVYANYIKGQSVTPAGVSAPAASETTTIDLDGASAGAGYYLVYGTGTAVDNQEIVAAVSLTTAKPDAEVTPKLDAPSITKKVKDTPDDVDTTEPGQTGGWKDVTDLNIGEIAEFKLASAVPALTGYTQYKYIVHDKMSNGLTFDPASVVVKIGNQTLASTDYTLKTAGTHASDCTFEIEMDLVALANQYAAEVVTGAPIEILYSAEVNGNAVINNPGNPNEVYLEYSNNPYDTDSTKKTPKDQVVVYTFEFNIFKYTDKNSTEVALPGAEFELSKTSGGAAIALIDEGNGVYRIPMDGETPTVTKIETPASGNVKIKGLDEGTYYLTETKAPDGYNLLENPIKVEIKTDYNFDEKDGYTGQTNDAVITIYADGQAVSNATVKVENNTGSQLPETGGIGRQIFTVVGVVLMLGAAVVLIARRKVSVQK